MSELKAVPADNYNGSPIIPTGNPMIDGVGPAAWAKVRFAARQCGAWPRVACRCT